ncbi:CTLH/CRA C-terminal to lish motif domain-containing protein [Podospora fimiseda]|uniref:CTLH/CRA C-terminal to lish motif domain-containing protein n=1 Tax=Podospora fimiseda TaxID=252190 RepID=A0AAN7BZG4_9PEZI|nr:CTLH/CRA C-terminal to lish motif domain-containing protein [Podospora fimiseda]
MSNWPPYFYQQGDLEADSALRDHIFEQFRKREQMNSSTSTATPARHELFEKRVAEVKSPKSDINAIILDYLTMEGYPHAAAKFSTEANLKPQQEDPSIKTRQEIQHAIHSGNVELAIAGLNELDPEILDKNPKLHFSLLRLQLVELIRKCNGGDIRPALEFATSKVGPRASTNEEFRKDLERAMSLLIFDHDSPTLRPELKALLSSDLRRATATKVNEAILARQDQRKEAAIRTLVRMRAWAEQSARAKRLPVPNPLDIELLEEDSADTNGHEPMITT